MAVKARVKTSQHMTQSLYEAWVVLDVVGNIVLGHCTCIAG